MKTVRGLFPKLLLLLVVLPGLCGDSLPGWAQEGGVLFRDDFETLEAWKPVFFPKIPRHSTYTIGREGGVSYLRAESNASASGLLSLREFNVYEYPRLRWRWKIENVYAKGDSTKKAGDDYPIRVYVVFTFDPDRAGLGKRLAYGAYRQVYGEYPPDSTLNYVWSNRPADNTIVPNPFTEKAMMIPLQQGGAKARTWQDEQVTIPEDYRKAFGTDPPPMARIAIMNDSDNTGERSVSYLDFIEVFR